LDFELSSPTDVPDTSVAISPQDFGATLVGDIAFGNDRLYASGRFLPGRWLDGSILFSNAGFASFASEEFSSNYTVQNYGFNAYQLTDISATAVSPDGTRIYQGKTDGTLLTLWPGDDGHALSLDERMAFDVEIIELQYHDNYLLALTVDDQLHRILLDAEKLPTGTITSTPTSSGSNDFSVIGDQLVVAARDPNAPEASFYKLSTAGFGTPTSFSQESRVETEIESLSGFAVSEQGDYFYAVSQAGNALIATSADGSRQDVFIDQLGLGAGPVPSYLATVSAVAVGKDRTNGRHFVAVASTDEDALRGFEEPAAGAITVFERTADGALELRESTAIGAAPLSLRFNQAGELIALLDADTDNLQRYAVSDTGVLTEQTSTTVALNDAGQTIRAGQFWLEPVGEQQPASGFVFFPAAVELRSYGDLFGDSGTPLTTDLTDVTDMAITSESVFVVSSVGETRIFSRDGLTGNLALEQTIRDETLSGGLSGVTGLVGASAVEISTDGNFLFVSSSEQSIVTVFFRDPQSGEFKFAQALENRRGGVRGLAAPSFMAFRNNQLIVGGDQGPTLTQRGGFALFDVSTESPENIQPIELVSRFTGIESVELNTKSGDDTIRVFDAPDASVGDFNISTSLGSDVVNLLAQLPDADADSDISLGTGQDTLTINHTGGGQLTADLGERTAIACTCSPSGPTPR
jgi:hypothetical protein